MLTPEWIRTHVEGYQDLSDDAFLTKIHRDIATLARAGVPLESWQSADGQGTVYRLQSEQYQLPEVSFTPEESTVLGLAGEMGHSGELGVFARSGWTKLAAAGASRDLSQTPVFSTVNDVTVLPARMLTSILTIIRAGFRMSFSYTATPASTPVKRTMDPWGLVPLHDRLYLVGYDVDRQAPRSFRILRISDVHAKRTRAVHTETATSLQKIVEDSLRVGRQRIDALLSIPEGSAHELAAAGTRRPDGLVELRDVDRDWLVRTAAGFAYVVELIEPADAREEIIALLSEVH
ncbi:WYL domain-containing protein [Corynebacterium alimapuense]|uniref:WYL domain-containing protein n=2 Tax=Corynebacterium alimapuense TaxID=1576874 RepID=A0A3M8KAA6_9CORY|nr:WYL domain-containing protein [Corynebacterium alimapuense]